MVYGFKRKPINKFVIMLRSVGWADYGFVSIFCLFFTTKIIVQSSIIIEHFTALTSRCSSCKWITGGGPVMIVLEMLTFHCRN